MNCSNHGGLLEVGGGGLSFIVSMVVDSIEKKRNAPQCLKKKSGLEVFSEMCVDDSSKSTRDV